MYKGETKMNENMGNEVMNEATDVMDTANAGSNLGTKIVGGLLVTGAVVGVGHLIRKGIRKLKTVIAHKKALKKAREITDVEYAEVTEEQDVQE